MEKKPILFLENIDKAFKTSDGDFYALKNINLSFPNKGLHCLVGKSGSGKSTLLNLLLQIEKPTKGEIFYKNKKISKFKKKDLNNYRNCVIGTIFQHYNLFEDLSVIDNIILPSLILGENRKDCIKRANDYIKQFNLEYLSKRIVKNLSGGEKQRVAIIRSIMNNPDILLCDEPTGALDDTNSVLIMKILKQLSNDRLVIVVSHNLDLVEQFSDRIITLHDGKIILDQYRNEIKDSNFKKQKINKRKFNWTKIFIRKHLKQNFVKNFLTYFSTLFGLLAIMCSIGFNNGIEETSRNAIQNNLAISTATVSKKQYIDIPNSPLQYEKSTRPHNDELQFLYNIIPSLVIEPNLSYFVPTNPTFSYRDEILNTISFIPIYDHHLINSYNEIVVNNKFLELLNLDKEEIIDDYLYLIHKVNPTIKTDDIVNPFIKDNIEIKEQLIIKEVVDEFSFLNNPKIYYSYPLFLEFVSNIKLENISNYLGYEMDGLSYVISSNDDSMMSSYSSLLFVKDKQDINRLFSLKDELDNEKADIRIESDPYLIQKTYVNFMTSFASSLQIFIIISFVGVCFIIGITSLSSFILYKKESAILTILGSSNSKILSIFLNESLFVILMSICSSLVLSFFVEKLINNIVYKYAQIENLISIPIYSYLGYPYLLPIALTIIIISISIIFIIVPLLIYKNISLSSELKDE